jgi:nicotinate-nucleotide adenylyltransferase
MKSGGARRVGILGGTFNPVHLGHLILAQSACERFDLAKVLFIPCGVPPHKNPGGLAPAADRLAMVRLAIEGDERFDPCDIEINRPGVSYAVDTVAALRELHPEAELHFIIGSDTLSELYQWRNIYTLLTLCRFAVFLRPDAGAPRLRADALHLESPWAERLMEGLVPGRQVDISSSDIRYRVVEGMSVRYLVPEPVARYIADHRLYR